MKFVKHEQKYPKPTTAFQTGNSFQDIQLYKFFVSFDQLNG